MFYLEGDLDADSINQYAFFAGLAELCKDWKMKEENFGYTEYL